VKRFARTRWSDGEWYLSCEEVLTFLLDYVEGELPAERRAEFDRHLAGCDSCRAYLESYRTTVRLAGGAFGAPEPPGEVPPELARAILDARRR
jgi:anti-sigma factor RsiW